MRSALFVGVVFLSLALVATGQANNSKGSGSTPDKQTTNPTAQERPAEPSNFTSAKGFVLEDTTPVRLRLNRTISSADSHVGDTVDFEVLQDISVNGTLVIPKGGLAFGTVTEAQPTRKLARGGKLEINVDYVKLLDRERAALRAVQGGKGGGRIMAMTAGIVATGLFVLPAPYFLLMHGKDMVIPKGAEVTGYINGDVKLDIAKFQESKPSPTPPSVVATNTGPDVNSNSTKLTMESGPRDADIKTEGFFRDHTYTNEYFTLSYPLRSEWVVETDLIRNRLVSGKQSRAANLLIAAVHIPQDVTELRADSSFIVLAATRSAHANTENCRQYLDTLATSLRASKSAKRKGGVSEYTVAGHEFSRANFEYRSGTSDRAVICSPARDYLLLWKVEGSFWESVDEAASTIYAIVPWPPEQAESSKTNTQIRISGNASAGLLLRKVQPVYPAEPRENHIQGTVRLQAVISKTGDVVNLELLEGPIELAMSAVTAVRQWKYRPYLLNGEPVAVCTEVVVNYSLGPT
jgi:TonB family protein